MTLFRTTECSWHNQHSGVHHEPNQEGLYSQERHPLAQQSPAPSTVLLHRPVKSNRTWHKLAIDDVDIPAVAKAWNRFSEGERGRLERVVQGGAQHSLNVRNRCGQS